MVANCVPFCLAVLGAGLAPQSEIQPAAVLEKGRARVLATLDRLPHYTCVQTIRRAQYRDFSREPQPLCGHVTVQPGRPALMLAIEDRLRLDVSVAQRREIFSWAGAKEFDTTDAHELIGSGLTATGDFGFLLTSIFADKRVTARHTRRELCEGAVCLVYTYQVPTEVSQYRMKLRESGARFAAMPYSGEFSLQEDSGELRRLTVRVSDAPPRAGVCRIETAVRYTTEQLGGVAATLPQRTEVRLWDEDGSLYRNETEYRGCRAFQAESVFRADVAEGGTSAGAKAAAGTLPADARVRIRLRTKLSEEATFAGDAIEGELAEPIRVKGKTIAPSGAPVEGRIYRFERHWRPSPYTVVGIRYSSLRVEDREFRLNLVAQPSARDRKLLGKEDAAVGLRAVLPGAWDDAWVSEWRTR